MKKIALITSSRADWGILSNLADMLYHCPSIDLNIIATGAHLSPAFGSTVNQIHLPISAKLETVLSSDTPVAICKTYGLTVISFGELYESIYPDLILVLGDRFEISAACVAAYISNIPIAHIGGGETTAGVYDDGFRHSITHMAKYHFVYNDYYRERVVQLIEDDRNVYNVGALPCDGLEKVTDWPRSNDIYALIHPETRTQNDVIDSILLLRCFFERDYNLKFITSGYDVRSRSTRMYRNNAVFENRNQFLKALSNSYCIIGNSSSGIVEAPALGIPTINIGNRQSGRMMADSIICTHPTAEDIKDAFEHLQSPGFSRLMKSNYYLPYKGDNVAKKIFSIIRKECFDENLL